MQSRHEDYEDDREERRDHKMKKRPMKLILAHFNPKELEEMDYAQGGATRIPGTREKHYKELERRLSTPEGERVFVEAVERHAAGGMIGEKAREIESMRHKGRNGDSEMAYIGPNTHRIFDRVMADLTGNHRKNENPHTKKPEYFGLGSFLGGVGKTISKGVSGLGNMATKALPGAVMGGMMGGPEGALMGGLSSAMAPSPHAQSAPQQSYQQPAQSSYQPGYAQQQMGGANQYGQQQLGNAYGSGSSGLQNANAYGQNAMQSMNNMGQNFIQNMANRASSGLNRGTQYGQNTMQQGTNSAQGAMDTGAMYGSAGMNQANNYGQNMANNYDQNQQQMAQQQLAQQQNQYNQRWGQQ